jgi:hypothetical protein
MPPSQRHSEKKPLKVYLTRELHLKFQRLAESRGCTMSDLLFQYVHKETKNIELTAADYEQIAAELRAGNKY